MRPWKQAEEESEEAHNKLAHITRTPTTCTAFTQIAIMTDDDCRFDPTADPRSRPTCVFAMRCDPSSRAAAEEPERTALETVLR